MSQTSDVIARSPRVLIVEDDRATAGLLEHLLKRRGCDVRLAHSLADAHSHLTHEVHWVVLDLVLPDGDGAELIKAIRHRKLAAQVTVLTGVSQESRLRDVGEAGGVDRARILRKPADFSQLLKAMNLDDTAP